jgi:heme-degrading monooxygenase HmoA
MYLLRSDLTAAPGGARELEEFADAAYARLREAPGFVSALLGNALGFPDAYVSLITWQSRALARHWRMSEASLPLCRQLRAQTLMTLARPTEAYELLYEERTTAAAGTYLGFAERTVSDPTTQAAAFEETARRVSALRRRYGAGFVANGLARFLGGGGRYMAVLLYTDEAAAAGIDSAPEIAVYRRSHPFGAFTGPAVLTHFELVHVVRAASE